MRSSLITQLILPSVLILGFAGLLHAQIDCMWGLNVRVVGPDGNALEAARLDLEGDKVPPRHLIDDFVSWGHPMGTGPKGTYSLKVQAEGHKPFETQIEFPICDMHYYEVKLPSQKDSKDPEIVMLTTFWVEAAPNGAKSRPFDRIELVDEAGVGKSLTLKWSSLREVIRPGNYQIKGFTIAGDLVFTIPRLELKEGTVIIDFRFPKGIVLRDALPVTTCNQIENGDRQLECVVVP